MRNWVKRNEKTERKSGMIGGDVDEEFKGL
jgi:hypothetical protein